LRRIALDKQIRNRIWTSLGKSERATTTPDQLTLTPEEHAAWVKKLYREAVGKGVINAAFLAANTNLTAVAAQIKSRSTAPEKGATLLIEHPSATTAKSSKATPLAKAPVSTDPMEILLMATIPVSDSDFQALADNRARAVRAYLLQTGKVEADRLFLAENQTGGVKSEGSRVYLQFQ